MVKITIEADGTKTEMSGRCVFAAVVDSEGDGDMATGVVGKTSPYNLVNTLGMCIGTQIKALVPEFIDQIRLIQILDKSVARGIGGDVEAIKIE